jgi:ABC-type multidrug transport system fused ATPase/permease subunit
LKKFVQDILHILSSREKKKLWWLSVADVFISVLDIAFLIGLLLVINFYTRTPSISTAGFGYYKLLNEHPLVLILVFFPLFTLKNVLGFFISKWQYQFVYDVASRLSRDNLLQYLNGNYVDFVNVDSSVIGRKISQQPVEFSHYVLNGAQQIFCQLVLVLITLSAIVVYNPLLFPLLVLILAPPVFGILFFMKRKLDKAGELGKKTSERSIQHLQEALSGYIESNVYLKNNFFTDRYGRSQSLLNRHLSERLIIQSIPTRLIEVFVIFGLFLLILVNYLSIHNGTVQLVTIGAFMVAAYKIIPGIVKITNTVSQIKTYAYTMVGLANSERLDAKTPSDTPIESIECENIYTSHRGKTLLQSFSFNIKKGEVAGINGVSGRGKTTFINLLLGFLTPDSGKIYINGQITDSADRKSYWGRISYIKQQFYFLHASIAENIAFREGVFDKDKMNKVLSVTGLDKMISQFSGGLDTIITENGKNFSGGQRQRFILARALYHDFDLLVLDEPFNELDESAEKEMLNQLKSIAAEGKMVILITHNKEALSFCNRKFYMDEQGE